MAWSLYKDEDVFLPPLQFSNGKTQQDVVEEVIASIKEGQKIIFIHGVCGSGKSALALNIAKEVGKASIVVPVKYLQSQYEEDYEKKLCVKKENGEKLKIKVLTGRNNHPCLYNPSSKADDMLLPCTIPIVQKNMDLISVYVDKNPLIKKEEIDSIDDVRRLSVAPACPYWSPIIGNDWFGEYPLKDAKKHEYLGLNNKKFTLYERKGGCSYYRQFIAYKDADVLIFNAKKYELENVMERKPATDVEIIDECDEFLDNLGNEKRVSLTFFAERVADIGKTCKDAEMKVLLSELYAAVDTVLKSRWLKNLVEENELVKLADTKLLELFNLIASNEQLLEYEDFEYIFAVAKHFEHMVDATYVQFEVRKNQVIAHVVNVNLEKKMKDFLDKNKVFVMMSGTLHSKKVLKDIFGIREFKVIEAEGKHLGKATHVRTGKEKNCRYREFESGRVTREEYVRALDAAIQLAKPPILVHVNSFQDLPTETEKEKWNLSVMSQEKLREQQEKYKSGQLLQWFKEGKIKVLYSTKCNRGVDLPGEMCNAIVLTKYPFPSMSSLFWRVLKESKPDDCMEFYFDKARREFLQRIYRGLRSKEDTVQILSPDLKVMQSKLD